MSSSKKRGKAFGEGPSSQKKRREISKDDDPSSPFAWTPSGVQVLLPSCQRLIFTGRATLTVHSGEIDIAGSVLTARNIPTEIYTDETAPLIISVVATEGRIPLATSGSAGFSLAGGIGSSPENRGFELHLEHEYEASAHILEVPVAWKQAAAGIVESILAGQALGAPPPVIAICGTKKVGKSTFARYLTNVLLNIYASVAYLDTDCGQPEFTPPGLVSLSTISSPVLGPPHLHQHTPTASYFIGDTSPSTDPARYLCSITNLYEWYCTNDSTIGKTTAIKSTTLKSKSKRGSSSNTKKTQLASPPPLIVNTHGWVKGFGFDLIVDTLRMLSPTHYVHILHSNPRRNLPQGVFWAVPPPPSQQAIGNGGAGQGASQQQIMPVMFDIPALDPPTIGAIGSALQRGRETAAGPSSSGHESDITAAAVTPAVGGQSRRALPAPPAAVEQRVLHWIAFSQRCVAAHSQETSLAAGGGVSVGGSTAEEVGDQLASTIPYVLSFSDVFIRVIHTSVLPEQLAYALNGAIVGLCGKHHNGGGGDRGAESDALLNSNGGLAPCLGLGLIRAADGASGKLYIVTPLSLEELEKVDLIEIGRLELPPTLLQTGKFLSPYLALHSLSTAGTGAGVIKSRNNLMRSSQR